MLVSPTLRTRQTAAAFTDDFEIAGELAALRTEQTADSPEAVFRRLAG